MEIVVVGKNDSAGQEIGLLILNNEFYVEDDGDGRWVAVTPRDIEGIKVNGSEVGYSGLKVYVVAFQHEDSDLDIERVCFEKADAEEYVKYQNKTLERGCDESELWIVEKKVSHNPKIAGIRRGGDTLENIEKAIRNAIGAEVVELASKKCFGGLTNDEVSKLVKNVLHSIAEGQDF